MKVQDLQIGDWVKVTDDDTNDFFEGRIISIDGELGNVTVKKKGQSCWISVSVDCVEPVKLTPEILEKNGWTADKKYLLCNVYFTTPVMPSAVIVKDDNSFEMHHGVYSGLIIKNVHELQHALHLAGIDKKIEL